MDKHQAIISKSAEETAALGEALAASVMSAGRGDEKNARLFCLYGNLGSGKTTFTQGFAKGLGITTRLLSPTFIIVRRYNIPKTGGFLYHMDLYRLQSKEQLGTIGIDEMLADNGSVVVIEWAEKMGELPSKRVDISFSSSPDGDHEIHVAYI